MTAKKAEPSKGGYYVYELINPISLKVFYVGKGKNNRAFAHVKEALANKVNNLKKYNAIKEILSYGLLPITNILLKGVATKTPLAESEEIAKKIIMVANYDLQTSKREEVINNALKDIESANKILALVARLKNDQKPNFKTRKILS
jgi:hypothetical protein